MSEKENKKQEKKKKSLLSRVLKFFAIIILILLLALFCAIIFIDSIVKTAVTTVGPEITGTPFLLEEFDSSLLDGEVTITNLAVGNPEGYQSPNALSVAMLHIKIDLQSLLTDCIVIDEIIVDGLHVDYEIQSSIDTDSLFSGNFGALFPATESNLTRILSNVEDFANRMAPAAEAGGESEAPATEPAAEEAAEEAPAKEVQIKHILVKNTVISFSSAMLSSTVSIPMPSFEIDNTEKTSYAEMISIFFKELYTNVVEAVMIYLRDNSIQLANVIGAGLNSAAGAVGEQMSNLTEGVGEQLGNITSGIGEQMGNLFSGAGSKTDQEKTESETSEELLDWLF